VNLGQKLLTLTGQEPDKSGKMRNVWENHGFFLSRTLALKYAQEKRPGKKVHIEGARLDASPISSQKTSD
jgi:hypothetical protein